MGAPTPPEIQNNPKTYPFFKDALVPSMGHIYTAVAMQKCTRKLVIANWWPHAKLPSNFWV